MQVKDCVDVCRASLVCSVICLICLFSPPISHSQHPQCFPQEPAVNGPRRKWHHLDLQCHKATHPPHVPLCHLVGEEGYNIGGNFDIWPRGRRFCRAEVRPTLHWWGHPTGSREKWIIWTGDIQSDIIWWRELWVQRNRMDAWKRREMDKNYREHTRDGNCFCYSHR